MTNPDIEQVNLEQDWFSVCDFSQEEINKIVGNEPSIALDRIDRLNTLGTYLVEVVGIYATEFKDWMQSDMKSLDMQRPIDVLAEDQGFQKVFDVAAEWFVDMQNLEKQGILQKGLMGSSEREKSTVWDPADSTRSTAEAAVKIYDGLFQEFLPQGERDVRGATLGSVLGRPYVRYQKSSNGLEAYKVELPDGEHRISGMSIMMLSEGADKRRIIKVERWDRLRSTRTTSDEENIPHDFSPAPDCFDIIRFSQTIKRLAKDGSLELLKS